MKIAAPIVDPQRSLQVVNAQLHRPAKNLSLQPRQRQSNRSQNQPQRRPAHPSIFHLFARSLDSSVPGLVSKIRCLSRHDFSRAEKRQYQRALAPEELPPTSVEPFLKHRLITHAHCTRPANSFLHTVTGPSKPDSSSGESSLNGLKSVHV